MKISDKICVTWDIYPTKKDRARITISSNDELELQQLFEELKKAKLEPLRVSQYEFTVMLNELELERMERE